MQLSLLTWNAININDGTTYSSWIPEGQLADLQSNGVSVARAGNFPFLSTSTLPAHDFRIEVTIAPGQNINVRREALKAIFNVMDSTKHNLVAADVADSNRQWYLSGLVTRFTEVEPNTFSIVFDLDEPIWKVVTALTDTWNVTASGQTRAITNIGNIAVKPVFEITPTTTKSGGLTFRRWVPVYNNLDVSFIAPFDITSGGFDTATLTTAKMQADGDDFLVMIDGSFVDRWLSAMDTAATKVWINLTLAPRREGTTSVTISNVGAVTTISFVQTKASLTFLTAMQKVTNKVVLIDSEAFTFTGVDLVTYQLTGVTRAQRDTTAATHTAPKTARWIEHDIWFLYGDSTLTAPDVDDDNKPMFSLASTNAQWTYSELYDSTAVRPGAWKPEVNESKTGLSYVFTANENTFADPATKLGLAAIGVQTEYAILSEVAQLDWLLSHPAGFTAVSYAGKKYYAGLSWPEIVGLQYLEETAAKWFTQQNEDIPTEALVWYALGPHVETLPATYKTIRFAIDGTLRPALGELALVQFDTVVVSIASASLPTAAIGAEQAINWFDVKLTNNTTGLYLKVACQCKVNDTLTIDCENKRVYLSDGSRVAVTLSTEREAWLDLRSGANTLQYDDTGTVAVTVETTHRDRNL